MAPAANRLPPRIGRPDVWDALNREREKVLAGLGRFTLLEGGPGLGKSTFLELAAADAHAAGFQVFRARPSAYENPPPFALARDLVASITANAARTAAAERGSSLAFSPTLVPGSDPTVSEPFAWDPLRTSVDGAQAELASERHRFAALLADPVFDAAGRAPVLLALDDLQRADAASMEFLESLLPRVGERPVWIVATLDPTAPQMATSASPLQSLCRRPEALRIEVRALAEAEMDAFLAWLAPQRRFNEAERHRLFSATNGVPAFLAQLVRYSTAPAAAAGAGGGDAESALPELDEDSRRLLALAVVSGNEFSFDVLRAAADLDEEAAAERLERLVELGVLAERELGRFGFAQERLRYKLYSELSTPRLRLLHERIAKALERTGSRDVATVYALARHTYHGRMDEAAVEYNRRAAEFAVAAFQADVALVYLGQALEALKRSRPDDRATELKLRLEIAAQRSRAGELPAAEAVLDEIRADEALWRAAGPVEGALFAVMRARVLADQGRWDEAERSLLELAPDVEAGAPVPLRISALRLRGEIRFFRGQYAGALEAHEASLRIAAESGEAREAAGEAIRHATALSMLPGREEEAVAEFRSAIERLVALGDRSEAAFGLLCLGAHLSYRGQVDEARVALHRAVELAEASHDLRRLGWARLNLADIELQQGRLEEAEAHNREALSLFDRLRDAFGRARAFLTQGQLAVARGLPEAAKSAFELSRRIFAEENLKVGELEVGLRDAEVDLAIGNEASARQTFERLRADEIERLRPDLLEDYRRLGGRLNHGPLDGADTLGTAQS